jgi:hypothetical protein
MILDLTKSAPGEGEAGRERYGWFLFVCLQFLHNLRFGQLECAGLCKREGCQR